MVHPFILIRGISFLPDDLYEPKPEGIGRQMVIAQQCRFKILSLWELRQVLDLNSRPIANLIKIMLQQENRA